MNLQPVDTLQAQDDEVLYQRLTAQYVERLNAVHSEHIHLMDRLHKMEKAMRRALDHADKPRRLREERYAAFFRSFTQTRRLLVRCMNDLTTQTFRAPELPDVSATTNWREACEDVQDVLDRLDRQYMRYRHNLFSEVLEVLDALDRLLDGTIERAEADGNMPLSKLLQDFWGVRCECLIHLTWVGLERLPSPVGQSPDLPTCKIIEAQDTDGAADVVISRESEAGYLLNGQLLRKTAVIVSGVKTR